nr:DUF333 domain-containing protein [uncultured Acetobacter sp.]
MIKLFSTPQTTFRKKIAGTTVLGVALLGLAACQPAPATAGEQAGAALPQGVTTQNGTGAEGNAASAQAPAQRGRLIGMANPASVHCVKAGGKLEIRKASSGGQYGVCHMPDGNSCEEWSFFRTGQCKAESLQNR